MKLPSTDCKTTRVRNLTAIVRLRDALICGGWTKLYLRWKGPRHIFTMERIPTSSTRKAAALAWSICYWVGAASASCNDSLLQQCCIRSSQPQPPACIVRPHLTLLLAIFVLKLGRAYTAINTATNKIFAEHYSHEHDRYDQHSYQPRARKGEGNVRM